MLRPRRCYDICPALRTLVTNHSSHEYFPRFCFLKLSARHCKAVTRGTPKAQHRQAAGALRNNFDPAITKSTLTSCGWRGYGRSRRVSAARIRLEPRGSSTGEGQMDGVKALAVLAHSSQLQSLAIGSQRSTGSNFGHVHSSRSSSGQKTSRTGT